MDIFKELESFRILLNLKGKTFTGAALGNGNLGTVLAIVLYIEIT
jgi:hypothetical protein